MNRLRIIRFSAFKGARCRQIGLDAIEYAINTNPSSLGERAQSRLGNEVALAFFGPTLYGLRSYDAKRATPAWHHAGAHAILAPFGWAYPQLSQIIYFCVICGQYIPCNWLTKHSNDDREIA